jgi:hypothetical protein
LVLIADPLQLGISSNPIYLIELTITLRRH